MLFVLVLLEAALTRQSAFGIGYRRAEISSATDSTPHFYYLTIQGSKVTICYWRDALFISHLRIKREVARSLWTYLRTLEDNSPSRERRAAIGRIEQHFHAIELAGFLEPKNGFRVGHNVFQDHPSLPAAQSWVGLSLQRVAEPQPVIRYRRLTIPLWLILTLLLVFPLKTAAGFFRVRRPREINRCSTCGYDLRASPDHCPECGVLRQPKPVPTV